MNQYFNLTQCYHIIDNFYTNPESIRNFALAMDRNTTSDGKYAGVMTTSSFITPEHLAAFSKITGESMTPNTSFTGKFRFTKTTDTYTQDIHFDPGENNCAWAGIIYLTPNIEQTDGTIFWKHKRTGLDEIPRTMPGLQQYGWNSTDSLRQFLETEGIDHTLWERTLTIPYKFNRLVLFRPWLFHSPGPAFGDNIESSRLVQTFFFRN